MKEKITAALKWLTRWDAATAITAAALMATFIAFDLIWCSDSTFRSMSSPSTWVSAILVSLILALPVAMWRAWRIESALLLVLDGVLISNLMYARTYAKAIPLSGYDNAGNLADFLPAVTASMRWADALLPLIGIIAIAALWRTARRSRAARRTNRAGYLCCLAIPAIIAVANFPTPGHFKRTYHRLATADANYARVVPTLYTIFGSLLYDVMTEQATLTEAQRRADLDKIASLPPVPPLPEGLTAPRNLVLIVCESLESWVIDTDYEGQPITPFLNSLVADSTTFYDPNVVSQARDGRSIDGQMLTVSGLYPLQSSAFSTQFAQNYFPSIIKAMKQDRDARTTILTGDHEFVWNQGTVYRQWDVDSIVSFKDFTLADNYSGRRHIGDKPFMEQCAAKLSGSDIWPTDKPVFIQMVTYTCHLPFKLPAQACELEIAPGTPEIMAKYMQATRYTDGALRIIIDYLRSRPDWNETMVAIIGDHEGLASDRAGIVANPIGKKYVNPRECVPLIVLNSPIPGKSTKVMGQVDVYPTLIQLMGLQGYEWPGLGKSVFDPSHPSVALAFDGSVAGENPDSAATALRATAALSDRIIRFNLLAP